LTWFDRAGKNLGVFGPPSEYSGGDVALSRDGKLAAVSSRQQNNRDIWLADTARGVPTRFTLDRAVEGYPVWSPDGTQLVFSSNRDGVENLYRKAVGNTASEEPLLKSEYSKRAFDWSADGKFLLYSVLDPKSNSDLWVLPMDGDRKPVPFLTGPYDETQGQFSPTPAGAPRWVAYSSAESGRYEIYVQSFPSPARQYRISTGGGEEPRWRGDGKEIYYTAPDGKLMAVEVKTTSQFEVIGSPKALFQIRSYVRGRNQRNFRWAPTPDGQRFLVISEPEETAGSPITVVLNWEAAVKK
jgi:Tol biopolymer transport system component